MAIFQYAVAVVSVAVALGVRLEFARFFGENVPYLQFFPAIVVASWFGGFGPGVVATALSAIAADYYFLAPAGFGITDSADVVSFVLFSAVGLVIATLNERLHAVRASLKAEAASAENRAERLSAIINTTVDGIIVIGRRGLIESFNPGAQRMFGYSNDEVLGRNVSMLMPSPYRQEHDGYLARYEQTGRAQVIGSGRQVTGLRKDGSTFPLHLSVGESNVNGERRFTGILHDLTARVALESQLHEQSALVRLGEMAALIAHEVKNPLAGIRGALQVIGRRLPADNADAPVVKEIIDRVDSLDAMMQDLLLFAPPQPKRVPTDIVPLVRMTADLLKRDHVADNVDIEIGGSAPPVPADASMLTMVIQNLLLNGIHAVNGRGHIHVGVATDDGWCRIAVADDGPGIPSNIRDKIFTPFFTTKKKGTGLGLPTSKRFVEAHNGHLSVECPPTGGTTVTIELPLT